jgi:N-acetylmuramoyl-L-alanine amidase
MNHLSTRHLPLGFASILLLAAAAGWWFRSTSNPPSERPTRASTKESPARSLLAEAPNWAALEIYQKSISRADFEKLLTTVFTTGSAWRSVIEIKETEAIIRTGRSVEGGIFQLQFAPPGEEIPPPRHWRTTAELPPASPQQPLAGLKIAIDPGHIGGSWAKMEERWLQVDEGLPVCEGDMTLLVANLLKPQLEALGAVVSLVRDQPQPVTPLRPDVLRSLARGSSPPEGSPAAIQQTAERLFYRTAEIHARASFVNHQLKPDLVLCLHFNADPWGDPTQPTLVERTHLHLLLNGAYTDEEVLLEDQRFALLLKLLQRSHHEEALVGATVADSFASVSGLPPFSYPAEAKNVLPVPDHPYLWIRNLLANRLYHCPVIFMEPYVMNSTSDYPRLQAGDYIGLKQIGGKSYPSIFREYADALTAGLVRHYTLTRAKESTNEH